ncbi:uncharacterized protein LOC141700375 [Apium graveolens]|uniref:uncharacterized protein LOC141700375 n=1 Tax=Apium graveolens TaxID=4045 RepID=UPI003D7B5895
MNTHQTSAPPSTSSSPKRESGETSGTKKPEGSRKRKGNFYPFNNSEAKGNSNIFGNNILNIVGKPNRKELIDTWEKEISLIIQTNKDAYDDQNTVLLLIEHKTLGVINNFIKNTTWEPVMSPVTAFENILDDIYTMFLEINQASDKLQELLRIKEKARTRITNMQLCNICFLNQFFCDYEKYLYQLDDQAEYVKYVKYYLLKIPLVGLKALERFNLEATGPAEYSLAYAQRIVKEEISKICDLTKKQKQLKSFSKQCCEKIVEKPFEYGCRKSSYKKHYRKKSYKHKTTYKFIKKKKPYKSGKYFKKKSSKKFSNDKKKFCPKGKKNCRCWICNEEGHYANECPNRKKNDDKVQMLEQVYSLGYIPIEDPYEDTQEVYSIEELDPGLIESDSNESTSSESD